jgi:hypothetical protein
MSLISHVLPHLAPCDFFLFPEIKLKLKGTTSRVMAADRPYGGFYEFYSVNPEYFRYTLV